MKKFLSVVLAMSTVFGSLSAVSMAAADSTVSVQVTEEYKSKAGDKIKVGDYTYTVLNDGTLELTDVSNKATKITVPAKVKGKSVTSIGGWAFSFCSNLTSVTLPTSVKKIGSYAFSGCDKLTSVSLPKGLKTIGSSAFYGCKTLKTLTIPATVTTIEYGAFRGCSGLTKITIPNSVTSLSGDAFDGCTKLTAINVGTKNKNYTSVGGVLFNKKKTDILRFPEGKKGAYTVPNSVEKVGYGVFANCKGLTSVKIPKNTYTVSPYAFSGCTNLTTISVDANNTSYSSAGGVLFTKKKTGLVSCPEGKKGKYTIPKTVTEICYSAFEGCAKLTSVTIPNNVQYIDDHAFENCTGLASIAIPANVSSLDYSTFWGCTKLTAINVNAKNKTFSSANGVVFNKKKTELIICPAGKKGAYTVPNSVKTIGKYSFYQSKVSSVKMQSGVTTIADSAFAFNKSLTSVIVPTTVKSIENWAFCGNSNLKNVNYTSSKANWNKIKVGSNNDSLKKATIHYNYHDKVANLKAAPAKTSVKLTWSKTASASYYKVWIWKNNKWTQLTQTKSNTTVAYTASKLKANTSYKFRVTAYNKSGKAIAYTDITAKTKK